MYRNILAGLPLFIGSLFSFNLTGVAANEPHKDVYVHVAIMPDPADETASVHKYNFNAEAYLKCQIIALGGGESSASINAQSLATIRLYVQAMKDKDLTAFLDSCFPLPTYQKQRVEEKDKEKQYFDFWSARFKIGQDIALDYALLYGDSIYYLAVQKDPAAPNGMFPVEVIETKSCGPNIWRCAIGEYAQVKTSVIAAFCGCAFTPPLQTMEHLEDYAEIPVVDPGDNGGAIALLLPKDQTGAKAEAIQAGCAVAGTFEALLRAIGNKGSLDPESKVKLKDLCTPASIDMLMHNLEMVESPALAGAPDHFRDLWHGVADLYDVQEGKYVAIPAGNNMVLWAMNSSGTIRQVEFQKETDSMLICGVGGEHDDIADFLNSSRIRTAAREYIDKFGIDAKARISAK